MNYIPGERAYLFNNPNQYRNYPKQKLGMNRPVPVVVGVPLANNSGYMGQQGSFYNKGGYDYSMPNPNLNNTNNNMNYMSNNMAPINTNVRSSQNSVTPLNALNENITPIMNAINSPNVTPLSSSK